MKKYLLIASAAVFTISANAQVNKNVAEFRNVHGEAEIIDGDNQFSIIKAPVIPNNKAVSTPLLGTSYNVFTILGDRQNQVCYNPEINTVGFVHRQNDGGAGGSGVISFDYSTDGGVTWINNPFQTTPVGDPGNWNGNRYPNMALYNPTGNTNSANAYLVQCGPSLANNAAAANGWAKTFRASAKFDGSDLDETYFTNSTVGPSNDNNEWGAAGMDVNTATNEVWYVSTNINVTGNLVDDYLGTYHDYFLTKGVYNSTNNNFDWTTEATITPGWYTDDNTDTEPSTNIAGLANMAWSPDGQTGYMVAMGADSNASANSQIRPYVMKSTDAGATWNNVADYDFSQDPVFQCYLLSTAADTSVVRPWFQSYDMVVDMNGELRIFVEVVSASSNHIDSLYYAYTAIQTMFLFEVSTNSIGGWDVMFVDSIYNDDFQWDTEPTTLLSHFIRPQASRSQDGSKVFYTWSATDPAISLVREFPEVFAKGHDLTTGLWTNVTNLSSGNNSDFIAAYQTIANITIESGVDKDYQIPIVYGTAVGGINPLGNALQAPNWNFINGVGFDAAEFNQAAPSNPCIVGVEENKLLENSVSIFPNPTTGILEIRLSNENEFDYTIVNVVGSIISTKHVNGSKTVVDLTNNAKGVYFVTIETENGSITKKVMLTK